MGLGKTFIGSEKMRELNNAVNLVICQKSKVDDWINHFTKYYESHFKMIYDCTKWDKNDWNALAKNPFEPCVMVINYELAWRRPELLKLTNFTLMLDESSLITNPTAKRSKFILKLHPENVILLSGTPTAGRYEKLWSQLKLLGWDIDEETFFKSYVDYKWIERNDGYWDKEVIGYKNVDHLKRRLAKFGAIFKKTDEVLDLPEQITQVISLKASKNYNYFCKHHYLELWKGPDKDPVELIGDSTLTYILYKRQLCGQYSQEKLEAFTDLVESTEDRLIVFYNFTEELNKLKSIVEPLRPISIVNGQIKDLRAYDEFDNSVTFVQYQAGAYGLNLQKANKIIYFTLPLGLGSCDLWEQSKKRIHRIGQEKTCFYYYLLVEDSVEIWNLDLLTNGKELTDELFEKEGKYHG